MPTALIRSMSKGLQLPVQTNIVTLRASDQRIGGNRRGKVHEDMKVGLKGYVELDSNGGLGIG